MKPCLLFPKDYDTDQITYYSNREDLIQDLRLQLICKWMAKGDRYIERTMLQLILQPLKTTNLILWRQEVLKDCIDHPGCFNGMYEAATRCIQRTQAYLNENHKKKPIVTANLLVTELQCYSKMIDDLMEIWGIVQNMQSKSRGITQFREMLNQEYGKFPILELSQLQNEMISIDGGNANEMWVHAEIGTGFKLHHVYVEDIVMEEKHKISDDIKKTAKFILSQFVTTDYIDSSDDNIKRELFELETCGLEQIHTIYMGMIRKMLTFFEQMRKEFAFYQAGDNYYHMFRMKALPMCFPTPIPTETKQMGFEGLYEPILGLEDFVRLVTNDSELHKVTITLITGANQGGKSTYLKSIGIAQVMTQCGLCVNAKKYSSPCYDEIFTHFTRPEDKKMRYSRFEEELVRLDTMFDHFTKHTMVLMNESLGCTTEQEGAQIALEFTQAAYEAGIVVFFVSHLYEYASSLYELKLEDVHFLNAERLPDGTRTFKMVEQRPNHTSYGMDLFDQMISLE